MGRILLRALVGPPRPARSRPHVIALVVIAVLLLDTLVIGLRVGILKPSVGTVTAAVEPLAGMAVDKPAKLVSPAVEAGIEAAVPDVVTPPAGAPGPPAPAVPGAPPAAPPAVDGNAHLSAFQGLSTWVDLYDTGLTPREQVAAAAAGGVQAVFVQTARYNSPGDIHDPLRLAQLIEAAHDAGLRVMVWYIADFVDLDRDFRRSQAAMAFQTPRGDRPDAFGLDIETEFVANAAERSRRLLVLSSSLRDWVGPAGTGMPMAAIVLPPLQLDLRPSWWPGFPFAELRPFYDVFVPMSYSSYRGRDAQTTYAWNLVNILELRVRTGDPTLPVHMAGGIADALPHVQAFVDASRDGLVLGGGLYDLHTTPPTSWQALQALRAE